MCDFYAPTRKHEKSNSSSSFLESLQLKKWKNPKFNFSLFLSSFFSLVDMAFSQFHSSAARSFFLWPPGPRRRSKHFGSGDPEIQRSKILRNCWELFFLIDSPMMFFCCTDKYCGIGQARVHWSSIRHGSFCHVSYVGSLMFFPRKTMDHMFPYYLYNTLPNICFLFEALVPAVGEDPMDFCSLASAKKYAESTSSTMDSQVDDRTAIGLQISNSATSRTKTLRTSLSSAKGFLKALFCLSFQIFTIIWVGQVNQKPCSLRKAFAWKKIGGAHAKSSQKQGLSV